jgi:ABC-2 type transport system permease protein
MTDSRNWSAVLALLAAETKRTLILTIRYPLNLVVGLIALSLVFLIVISAGSFFGLSNLSSNQSSGSVLVGYGCWMLVLGVLGHIQNEIQTDSQIGVLEAVMACGLSPQALFSVRLVASLLPSCLSIALVVGILALFIRTPMHFSALLPVPIISVVLTYAGFGFVLAGLALVYKRVEVAVLPVHLILMFVFSYSAAEYPGTPIALYLVQLIPGLVGVIQMKALLLNATDLNWRDFLLPLAVGFLYLLVGLSLFSRLLASAERRGRLAHY